MKKVIALIVAALMLLTCVSALAEGFEIVVVPKDASNPWFVRMNTGVEEYAKAHPEDTIYQKGTPEIDPTVPAGDGPGGPGRGRHLRGSRRPGIH